MIVEIATNRYAFAVVRFLIRSYFICCGNTTSSQYILFWIMPSFESWIACEICSVKKLISCFEGRDGNPWVLSQVFSVDMIQLGWCYSSTEWWQVPHAAGWWLSSNSWDFFWKYSRTATWWKLKVCITAYDTKKETSSLSGSGFFQFFLTMLHKLNHISYIWVGTFTGTENVINSWHTTYALGIHNAGETNKEELNFFKEKLMY